MSLRSLGPSRLAKRVDREGRRLRACRAGEDGLTKLRSTVPVGSRSHETLQATAAALVKDQAVLKLPTNWNSIACHNL